MSDEKPDSKSEAKAAPKATRAPRRKPDLIITRSQLEAKSKTERQDFRDAGGTVTEDPDEE